MSTPIADDVRLLATRFALSLDRLLGACGVRRLVVAWSGGLDSSLLLELAAQFAALRGLPLLVAHVDHGLQSDSAAWAARCATQAAARGLDYRGLVLSDALPGGASIEAWAREQRYAALATLLDAHAALLTAHHADDQAETVLQRLLWRAGPRGLAAMRAARPLGAGWLLRPLLAERRAVLRDAARALGLEWLEDPSNADQRHPRNRLRARVLPALEAAFPDAVSALTEVAALQGEIAGLLDELAEQALEGDDRGDGTLSVARVLETPARLRPYVLQRWLALRGAPPPGRAQFEALQREALAARHDAEPCVAWRGVAVRRYEGRLHLTAARLPLPAAVLPWPAPWGALVDACGSLVCMVGAPGDLHRPRLRDGEVWVRRRSGGERLRLHAGGPRRELKSLFQEWHIPPWRRARWPLVYVGEDLAAVPGLAVAAEYRATSAEDALALRWTPRD